MAKSVFEIVTQRILEKLEEGTVPWHKPWSAGGAPRNLVSGKAYRGVNILLLGNQGFTSPFWVSFKQAKALGGAVRKGERGTPCILWKFLARDTENPATGEIESKQIPIVRYYNIFSVEQCDGISHPRLETQADEPTPFNPVETAETIVAGYPDPPTIAHDGGGSAYYRPSTDSIHMPERETFDSEEHYYATLFHEITHSLGAAKRLARPGVTNPDRFDSHARSQEEMVAELGSAFLLAEAGIDSESLMNNSAAYIASWVQVLRNDPKLIVLAAAQAQRAVDFVLMREFEGTLEAKAA